MAKAIGVKPNSGWSRGTARRSRDRNMLDERPCQEFIPGAKPERSSCADDRNAFESVRLRVRS